MSSLTESRQKAINLIEKLSQEKLPAVIQLLELLAETTKPPDETTNEEARLLAIIRQHLPRLEQAKLKDLRQRCERETLTEADSQELLHYEDKQEQLRVTRLSALMELAKLRNIDLLTLNREIQSTSSAVDAA